MRRATVSGGAFVTVLVLLLVAENHLALEDREELQLERGGDLGEGNAGMLIFFDGRGRPEYVQWKDVEQIDFDRPPAMYPPLGAR